MSIEQGFIPLGGLSPSRGPAEIPDIAPPSGGAPPQGGGFSGVMDAIRSVDSDQRHADAEALRVAEGRPGNVHDAVLAMKQAEISLELALTLRNKLVQAYEDIMRTQV